MSEIIFLGTLLIVLILGSFILLSFYEPSIKEKEIYCIEWDGFISRDGLELQKPRTDNTLFHGWKVYFTIDDEGNLLRWKYNDFIEDPHKLNKKFPCSAWIGVER